MVLAAVLLALVCLASIGVRFLSRFLLARDGRIAQAHLAMLDPSVAINPQRGRPCPWVIVNPSKIENLRSFKASVEAVASTLGVLEVHWLTTSVEDPGTGQAIEAVARGASIVIACGGDGTVRAVAAGLAGTGVRMGIIPAGTGNVLARNLNIPVDDVPGAVRVALGADHRLVDCGWLRVDAVAEARPIICEGQLVRSARTALAAQGLHVTEPESLPSTDEFCFVVIAGLGFDGETMAETDAELKKRIGWFAYVVAALSTLTRQGAKLRVLLRNPLPITNPVGDAPEQDQVSPTIAASATLKGESVEGGDVPEEVVGVEARTLMFANCGLLPLITLAPAARLDDGLLDVMAVSTQSGLLGWADVSWKILAQGVGAKTFNLPVSTGSVRFRQAEGASVLAQSAQVVQVDGDAIATARAVHVRLDRGALDIAVPDSR